MAVRWTRAAVVAIALVALTLTRWGPDAAPSPLVALLPGAWTTGGALVAPVAQAADVWRAGAAPRRLLPPLTPPPAPKCLAEGNADSPLTLQSFMRAQSAAGQTAQSFGWPANASRPSVLGSRGAGLRAASSLATAYLPRVLFLVMCSKANLFRIEEMRETWMRWVVPRPAALCPGLPELPGRHLLADGSDAASLRARGAPSPAPLVGGPSSEVPQACPSTSPVPTRAPHVPASPSSGPPPVRPHGRLILTADIFHRATGLITFPALSGKGTREDAQHRQLRTLEFLQRESARPDGHPLAHEAMAGVEWVVMVDDDSWVNVPALVTLLSSLNASEPQAMGWVWSGMWGRSHMFFSGGGVIAMTRPAFERVAPALYDDGRCGFCMSNDVTLTYCLWRLGVPLVHSPRHHTDLWYPRPASSLEVADQIAAHYSLGVAEYLTMLSEQHWEWGRFA
jgi:hypothetical protein